MAAGVPDAVGWQTLAGRDVNRWRPVEGWRDIDARGRSGNVRSNSAALQGMPAGQHDRAVRGCAGGAPRAAATKMGKVASQL